MQDRIIQSSSPGAVVLGLGLPAGSVHARIDHHITTARITLRTAGPGGAAAINAARIRQDGPVLSVEIPSREGPQDSIHTTHTAMNFTTGSGSPDGGHAFRLSAGALPGESRIRAEVDLPPGSSLGMVSVSSDAFVNGRLERVEFRSVSGSLSVGDARHLEAVTTSGSITVTRYGGGHFSARTVSGSVDVRVSPPATGTLHASSVSGDIRVDNSRRLHTIASSVTGRVTLR
ncbi:DUF4097 family beta strand repeat-containing protein [Streptomyces sp. NPDC001889]